MEVEPACWGSGSHDGDAGRVGTDFFDDVFASPERTQKGRRVRGKVNPAAICELK